jgi:hypothetical protein
MDKIMMFEQMSIVLIVIVFTVIIIGIVLLFRFAPRKSKLLINQDGEKFPVVTGFNLQRQELEFPRDFAGKFNLIFVPFLRKHQDDVDTWIPTAQQIESNFAGFIYYELPTLSTMSTLYRAFLNEGMRAGIPDSTSRQRTITLYLNKEKFKRALDIPAENEICLFLVNQAGKILWRAVGGFSQEKADDLLEILGVLDVNRKVKS